VIALEDRDEEGTAAAYPVPLRARLEGRQTRLANSRETRHVRGVVHAAIFDDLSRRRKGGRCGTGQDR
jgi:hypothetical protein